MTLFYLGATGVAVVCFVIGFFLGKSNVKSKIEQALEEGHGALDAREFAMRQQLEEAMAETARLRPLAQEYGRVQDRLRAEQSQYHQMKAEFDATVKRNGTEESGKLAVKSEQEAAPPPVSADDAIQKLMKSLELTMKEPGEPQQAPSRPSPVIEKHPPVIDPSPPAPRVQPKAIVEPSPAPRVLAKAVVEPSPTPHVPPRVNVDVQPKTEAKAPKAPKAAEPGGPAVDEWQEFARSLADLTRRNP